MTWERKRIPLTDLVTEHAAMAGTLEDYDNGIHSETPHEPLWVNPRHDMPGKYEIKDGHHRVADAIRKGRTHVDVDIDDVPDDEPYEPPFYDFSQHMTPTKKSVLTPLSFEEHYGQHERAAGHQGGQERRGLGEPRGGHRGASSRGLARAAGAAPGPAGRPGGLTAAAEPQPASGDLTWHPQAAKDLKRLDKPVQKQMLSTIDGIRSGDPLTLSQTHPLTGVMKGWYATKASRGHRVVHRPTDDGGIHIGYVGLHEYEKAIQRLTSRALPESEIGPLYHGTTVERAGRILEKGFEGDRVHLTGDPDLAHSYAQAKAAKEGGQAAVLRVDSVRGVSGHEVGFLDPDKARDAGAHYQDKGPEVVALDPSRLRGITRHASADHESYYHITDNPHFKPDPAKVPHDNTLSMSERKKPGLYLTKDPNHWGAAYGYQRPYLAEVHVPKGTGDSERWGNEHFVEGKDLDKVKVHRVIPLDEHIRENYGEPGRIESWHGKSHDGKELQRSSWGHSTFKEPLGEGYKYSGPDVRDMPHSEHKKHYERWRDFAVGGGIEGFPFGHNEFDDKNMTLRSDEPKPDDIDNEGQFIMRDKRGKEIGRKWGSRTGSRADDVLDYIRWD